MFPFCAASDKLTSDFSGAMVAYATVNEANKTMSLTLSLTQPAPPFEIKALEEMIASEFELADVSIEASYSRSVINEKARKKKKNAPIPTGTVIMGRKSRETPSPIGTITFAQGKATVIGDVCDVSHKELEKSGAWVLSFDLTDYTGTINVSKFMRDEDAEKVVRSIREGQRLIVSGKLGYSKRYENDLALEPTSIVTAEKEKRLDVADEKRVELHLHTKMSALDAVTDTAEVIKRAAEWGHTAIAITDHGVVHSFPDAAAAAAATGGKIKVLYGLEGYLQNDVDYHMAVFGDRGYPEDEFVVFDIETTGLSPARDSIFEIGAVLIKDGKELEKFHAFADPGVPVPYAIKDLTGVKDSDIQGAPSQTETVKAFLDFVNGRTLVAHNAVFDVGFIYEICLKHGLQFTPCYIDTLALARGLLPKLKNHKLETVAAYFGQTNFTHHKADEDAAVTAHIWVGLQDLLRKQGISETSQINTFLAKLRDERDTKSGFVKGRIKTRHIVLLVKNKTGLNNLYKLVTKSHLEHFDRYPIIRKSVLMEHREGLIIGSACEAGEVFDAISERRGTLELHRLAEFYDYLEIQPICNNMFMLYGDKPLARNEDELREFNRNVVQLGNALNKPVVATGDVHFLDPEQQIFRHILLTSKGFDSANDDLPVYFKTTDEMLEEFSYLGGETAYKIVIGNTHKIAGMCEVLSPLPPPKTLYSPKLEKSAEELIALASEKLRQLYGENPPEIVSKRFEAELHDILERNYDAIYMAAQKLVADSLSQGYLVGSRGSIGSSLVAFLAGITEVNALTAHYRCPSCKTTDFESGAGWNCGADMPDKLCPNCGTKYAKDGFNISFETFLGFDGDKVPDIDLNFSGEYQAQAHKFATDLFGADFVFRAGTIGTIKERTAYGYVKKYIETTGKIVTKAEENRLSKGCVGVKRTTGQHPGGLVVIPRGMEITDFCPAQHPADSGDKGIITTHFDYHCMEDNLIKLDLLGHDDPTMIKMLEDMTGQSARDIKLDDPETMAIFLSPAPLGLPEDDEIIGATGSIGIPEFGTGFVRQMLCDTKPRDFDTLIRLSGFSHGTDVWLGNAKELVLTGKASVSDTISCRDDIMLFLVSKGMNDRYAFRITESVRKGRGLPEDAEDDMISYGVPDWYIDSCKKITYLFPKAHAVAYVMMAFRIAWFKVHKPLEFYSAYFYRRSQKDSFDAECMTRGIEAVRAKMKEIRSNPDTKAKSKDEELYITLEACYEFYLRGFEFTDIDLYDSDPLRFLIIGQDKLRPPFVAIGGLGEIAARDLADNRLGREFISIDDISSACTKVSRAHLDQLKTLGALRNLPETSQMSLF